ncbi:MAG TPA: uracil-DNA glycosylase [Hyphomicrobium sp.]|nr:uracil-DNA glycosylase [Hyphomicrobium sp.]
MTDRRDTSEILGLLDWFRSMGVDAAVSDAPVDWLARGPTAPGHDFSWPNRQDAPRFEASTGPAVNATPALGTNSPVAARSSPLINPVRSDYRARPQTPLAPSEAQTDARRIAQTANTLDALGAALADFDGCSLKATASKLCFYRGAPAARLMIIGEAPGRDEDLEGKPFVGRAGQLLDKMLQSIGFSEADVHITNVVYWRPPGNRTPTPQEALACRPFLERQVELVRPEVILALGGSAAKEVLGATDGIMRLRGKWREVSFGSVTRPALATLHPAYLLRTPAAKQLAWLDMLALKSRLSV